MAVHKFRWPLMLLGVAISVVIVRYLEENDLNQLKITEFHFYDKRSEIQE